MRSLYLLQSYGMAGLEGEQVVIRRGGELLERVRLPLLDQILVMGNVQLSTPLLRACLRRDVAVAYLGLAEFRSRNFRRTQGESLSPHAQAVVTTVLLLKAA